MTTIAAFTTKEQAILVTDGAGTGPTGAMVAYAAKQAVIPHANAALAVRGTAAHLSSIVSGVGLTYAMGKDGFEEVCDTAAKAMRLSPWARLPMIGGHFACDLVIAGVGRDGPAVRFIANHNGHAGMAPGVVHDLDHLCLPHDPAALERALAGIDKDARHAFRELMQASRQVVAPDVRGRTSCQTAGFVQVTIISEAGVMTQVVGRWPDRIGEKPDPAAELL